MIRRTLLAGVLALALAPVADAHRGSIEIDCEAVTFTFTAFADAEGNTVTEHVSGVGDVVFTFDGSSGSNAVPHEQTTGTVTASADWDTNGHQGSVGPVSKELDCEEEPPLTTTEPPPTTTEPPSTTTESPVETTPPPTPDEPPSVRAARKRGDLPYTGLWALPLALGGAALTGFGTYLRRRKP